MSKPSKKISAAKRLERKFYHVFNDKSELRRIAFSGLISMVPAVMISNAIEEDPSTQVSQNVQEDKARTAAYLAEIAALRSEIPQEVVTFAIAPKNAKPAVSLDAQEKMQDIRTRAENIGVRLTLDGKIPEKDAALIAANLYSNFKDYAPMQPALNIYYSRAFLDEARAKQRAENQNLSDAQKAEKVLQDAVNNEKLESSVSLAILFLIFNLLDGVARASLRRGRERDDQNKREEKAEEFDDAAEKLREALQPKKPGRN